MTLFEISAVLFTAAAIGSFINSKWLKLPPSIGLMLLAMLTGLGGIVLKNLNLIDLSFIANFLANINFSETVFHGMLSFLLFAGALQINLDDLKNAKLPVAITATFSTVISTFLVGSVFYLIASMMGFQQITFLVALLFGAIISPTDPIAVMAIIQKMGIPKTFEIKIAGESLFNDGVAIVLFLTILELIVQSNTVTFLNVSGFLMQEVGGGIFIGFILGWLANLMLLKTDNYQTKLLITLAITTGGYVLAEKLHVSAPFAMVVAGIIIGNYDRTRVNTSEKTQNPIAFFWELIDEILNAILFILIGLEMMVISVNTTEAILASSCILLTLFSRYISVAIPIQLMRPFYAFKKGTILIMTWGGLRGALSIAMVLALDQIEIRNILLPCVYFVVVFSIAVQGLTFDKLLNFYGFGQKKIS